MAINTVTIAGTVNAPNAVGVEGGTITITLSEPGSVTDVATEVVVGTHPFEAVITTVGGVNFEIIPNGDITPAGTTYRAEYRLANGQRWAKTWTVPGVNTDIGDL